MQTSIATHIRQLETLGGSACISERQWQKELAAARISVDKLLATLGLKRNDFPDQPIERGSFPLVATQSYIDRISPGQPNDPLLRQILPIQSELEDNDLSFSDPVGDRDARRAPGLLQKYRGRALMMITGKCAIHCRYCFRQEYQYHSEPKSLEQWEPAFDELAADTSIEEVIFSGGDPLTVSDGRLASFVDRIQQMSHIQRIRIHSRMPIVLPSRITDGLMQVLKDTRLSTIVVVHANHPNEIAHDCSTALKRMVASGIPVLNQSVLLKDVNDNVDALTELSRRLVNLGVMPYYLHQLDRVHGSEHFEVNVEAGKELVSEMQKMLPGYAVPKYVREIPGQPSKTPL